MKGLTIAQLREGETADFTKTITEADINNFAAVTGDSNPVHIDPAEAAGSIFGGVVAHGMLIASLISAAIGTRLPGPGTVYLGQSLKFTKPVKPGDTVRAQVEVIALDPGRNRVTLKTSCSNQRGETVLVGEALVMPPKAGL